MFFLQKFLQKIKQKTTTRKTKARYYQNKNRHSAYLLKQKGKSTQATTKKTKGYKIQYPTQCFFYFS